MREVTLKLWGRHGEIWPDLPPFEVKTTGFSWSCWQKVADRYKQDNETLLSVKILNGHAKMTFRGTANVE